MKWYNTAFKYESIRDMAYDELKAAGIRCDKYIAGDGYYYIGWCPFGEKQYQIAVQIVTSHID